MIENKATTINREVGSGIYVLMLRFTASSANAAAPERLLLCCNLNLN